MIRLIIYIILFYLGYQALRRWLAGPRISDIRPDSHAVHPVDDVMVKDPQCGVFFPKKEAVHLRHGGQDLFFCSEKCKDDYLRDHP